MMCAITVECTCRRKAMRETLLFVLGFIVGGAAMFAVIGWCARRAELAGYCWPGSE
jgi:hypothetical protein